MSINCEDYIKKLIQDDTLTDEEIYEIGEIASRLRQQAENEKELAVTAPDAQRLAEEWAKREELKALQQKRNTILQYQARTKILNMCLNEFNGMEAEGLIAAMVGSKFMRGSARRSVDSIARGLAGSYMGQLYTEIAALGEAHLKLFQKGKLEREISDAMFLLPHPDQFKGSKEAMEIAQVIHRIEERTRLDQNQAGAWISNLPGYIVRQSHDAAKINKAGFDKWKETIETRLDWEKTAEGKYATDEAGRNDFLYETWKALVTGKHLHHTPDPKVDNPLTTATTSIMGSMAAKASHERVLHFASGTAWFEYNASFGRGSLNEALVHGLNQAAESTALMRVFGPSPQATLEWVIDQLGTRLQKQGKTDRVQVLQNSRKLLRDYMSILDGSENMDGNVKGATICRNLRAWNTLTKLGGALISSISDVPNIGFEFAYQGKGFFAGMCDAMRNFLGKPSPEQMRIAAQCGVFFDTMIGNIAARFSDDSLSGKMAAAQNLFFKLNGLGYWTDAWKKAAVLTMSHDLYQLRGKAWGNLAERYKRTLGLYGIDAERWDLIRQGAVSTADGRSYLTPDGVLGLPDEEIAKYLKSKNRSTEPSNINRFKTELADQLRAYYRDRVQYAVLEPDAKNRYFLHRGTASGTVPGEILRFVGQFKSFPTLFVQRTMGREIYGRGAETLGQGLKNQFLKGSSGERGNFFQMFLAMTAMGFLAMQAKAIAAGKTPRELSIKSLIAGALQGGGLGIMGDFLFGDFSRIGTGVLASMSGPTAGIVDGVSRIVSRARNGDLDLGPEIFRQAWSLIPGANLFYLQAILQMGIVHPLNEYMRPGYWHRNQQRVKKENNQTFWARPIRW